jgi:hypothetical protein
MIEPVHAVLRQVLAYWESKKGRRVAPLRGDIDPAEIAKLLPNVGLVEVERNPLRFRFKLAGHHIVSAYGMELVGRYLDQVGLDEQQHQIAAEYKRVVENFEPICTIREYTRRDGRHVRYERLALPLSTDGRSVDMIFGGCVFDEADG